jgi:thymidylate synthase ThyX
VSFTPREAGPYFSSRGADDHSVDPRLKDVAFNRHSYNDGHHVSPLDNGQIQVGDDGINVVLVQGLNAEFERVLSMATRATIGLDLGQQQGESDDRDWEEMLKGGLQTALESQVVVFAVSGASRTATHQIVRTRKGAFHQSSQRASWLGAQPEFRMPESIWNAPEHVRLLWFDAISAAHRAYNAACKADISYQDSRFILPEGTDNYIMMEYPLREFINVYAYRGCFMFQWEINSIMHMCRELLVARYSFLEPYIKISCEKTKGALDDNFETEQGTFVSDEAYSHHCTFQGWEQVEGQCPFAWARESNRAFRSDHHEIGRGVVANS